jgi:hypothetical protein
MREPHYFRLAEGEPFPDLCHLSPFKAVLVIEEKTSPEWQARASDWLVAQGCLYMMAWGIDCSEWDDSVDAANIKLSGFGDIPKDQFVFTTWHERDSLAEVFLFCKHIATHEVALANSMIVHISRTDKSADLVAQFMNVE